MLPCQPPLFPAVNRAPVRQAHFDSLNLLAVSSSSFLSALEWIGMTVEAEAASMLSVEPYPHMFRWLREEPNERLV